VKTLPFDYSGSPASVAASLYRSCSSGLVPVGSLSSLRPPSSSSAWSWSRWFTPGRGLTDRTPSNRHIMPNSAESTAWARSRAAIRRSASGRSRNHWASWSSPASGSRPGGCRRVLNVPWSAGARTAETTTETNCRPSRRSSVLSRSVTRPHPCPGTYLAGRSSHGRTGTPQHLAMARRWHAGQKAHPWRCDRPGVGPGLCCWFGVEPPAGIEPATPSLPSMRRRFTMSHATSRPHTSAQVKGAAEGWSMGRREAACSAVSGKFLARPIGGWLLG
jgi:hypothetical protein